MGSNTDEGAYFIALSHQANESEFRAWLQAQYTDFADILLQLYPSSDYPASACCSSYFYAAEHIVGDFDMTCPARRAAAWISRSQPQTYLYQFQRIPTGANFSFHSCEIPFVFLVGTQLHSDDDTTTAKHIASLWNTFAHTGMPGSTAVWPAYSKAIDRNLNINVDLSVSRGLRKAQCDFWDSIDARKCY